MEIKIINPKGQSFITKAKSEDEAIKNKGQLYIFNRNIEAQFIIKAKSREEALEIFSDWDNYSLIDEVMEVDKEEIWMSSEHIFDN